MLSLLGVVTIQDFLHGDSKDVESYPKESNIDKV